MEMREHMSHTVKMELLVTATFYSDIMTNQTNLIQVLTPQLTVRLDFVNDCSSLSTETIMCSRSGEEISRGSVLSSTLT